MTNPFFSIVIPTRDRPQFLEKVLWSLSRQTFRDFEVIISDNFLNESCQNICESYKQHMRLRYVHPDSPLAMPDNYNYGLSFAEGEYIYTGEDKICLYRQALEDAHTIIQKRKCEILTFDIDAYSTKQKSGSGSFTFSYYMRPTHPYNGAHILNKYTLCHLSYDNLNIYFRYGKMLFSFISRDLFKKIQNQVGNVFRPLSCDFTSLTSFLLQNPICYHVGHSLGIYIESDNHSTGHQSLKSYSKALSIQRELAGDKMCVETINWPEPRYPGAFYNSLAWDYAESYRLHGLKLKIDTDYLLLRIQESFSKQSDVPIEITKQIQQDISRIPSWKRHKDTLYNRYCQYFENKRWLHFIQMHVGSWFGLVFWGAVKKHRKLARQQIDFTSFEEAVEYAEGYYNSTLRIEWLC